ncbi:MAG: AMP-binding protein [Syntrophomonas sp.]
MNIRESIEALQADLSFRNIFTIMSGHQSNIAAEYLDTRQIKQITYAAYEKMIQSAAYQIRQIIGGEYQEGFVGLKLDNCPQWPAVFWGILMAGYKPVLLDFRLDQQMSSFLLAESGAVAIICSRGDRFAGPILKINAEQLWERDIEAPLGWEFTWADEMAFCTSGTTATARVFAYNGYAMSHSLLNFYEACKVNSKIMPESEARILSFVPYHHIYGFVASYLPSAFVGKTMVYIKDRAPSTILQACQIHKVTHIYGIPLLWNNMAASIQKEVAQSSRAKQFLFKTMCSFSLKWQRLFPQSAEKLLRNLFAGLHKKLLGREITLLVSGGGPVLPQSLMILNAIAYNVSSGYGMTEVGIPSFEIRDDIEKRLTASLGQPLGVCEYKIVPVNGSDDPDTGELYVKGDSLHTAQIKKGIYYPALIDKDGWFATGDIAAIKHGTMWLKGRSKEVIINESGENVYPDELEELFSNLETVEQLCVLGVKNCEAYEDITLVLYSQNDDQELRKQMIQEIYRVNRRLPVFKRLNLVLLSNLPLPITNTMKVQRLKLKEKIEKNAWPYITLDINHFTDSNEISIMENNYLCATEDLTENDFVSIKRCVKQCFAGVLHISPEKIHDDSHFINDLGGDSLSSLELLVKLEEKYTLTIPDDDYYQCNNVNELSLLLYGILRDTDREADHPGESSL